MYSRVCVWAETDNFGLIIVVESVCIFKTSVFLADARSWLHAAVFNTAFYIKPYRIIASSFMNTLWACLLTVKDSFRVFASTFIRNCAAQFPSVTWTCLNRRGERAYVLFCCDKIEIIRTVSFFIHVWRAGYTSHFQELATGTTLAVVWRLFYSLLIKWVLGIFQRRQIF